MLKEGNEKEPRQQAEERSSIGSRDAARLSHKHENQSQNQNRKLQPRLDQSLDHHERQQRQYGQRGYRTQDARSFGAPQTSSHGRRRLESSTRRRSRGHDGDDNDFDQAQPNFRYGPPRNNRDGPRQDRHLHSFRNDDKYVDGPFNGRHAIRDSDFRRDYDKNRYEEPRRGDDRRGFPNDRQRRMDHEQEYFRSSTPPRDRRMHDGPRERDYRRQGEGMNFDVEYQRGRHDERLRHQRSSSRDTSPIDRLCRLSSPSRSPPLVHTKQEWPPCFDKAGSVFIFHPASGMFYEEESEFYFDPKTKLYYGTRQKEYYRYDSSYDPPFVATKSGPSISGIPTADVDPSIVLPAINSLGTVADGKAGNTAAANSRIQIHLKTKKKKKIKSNVGTTASLPQPTSVDQTTSTTAKTTTTTPAIKSKIHKTQIANIEKWQEKQAEHKTGNVAEEKVAPPNASNTTSPTESTSMEIKRTAKGEPICTLCQRKFASVAKLRLHESKSDLHKKNVEKLHAKTKASQDSQESKEIQNDQIATPSVTKTVAEVSNKRKLNNPASNGSSSTITTSQYSDRALKRRQLHGAEPALDPSYLEQDRVSMEAHHQHLDSHPKNEENHPDSGLLADHNIGNQLLQKMGWSSGASLGSQNRISSGVGRKGGPDKDSENIQASDQIRKDWDRIEAIANNTVSGRNKKPFSSGCKNEFV